MYRESLICNVKNNHYALAVWLNGKHFRQPVGEVRLINLFRSLICLTILKNLRLESIRLICSCLCEVFGMWEIYLIIFTSSVHFYKICSGCVTGSIMKGCSIVFKSGSLVRLTNKGFIGTIEKKLVKTRIRVMYFTMESRMVSCIIIITSYLNHQNYNFAKFSWNTR